MCKREKSQGIRKYFEMKGKEDTTYYATPYVVKDSGEIVYGKAKAMSYNELTALDAQNQ